MRRKGTAAPVPIARAPSPLIPQHSDQGGGGEGAITLPACETVAWPEREELRLRRSESGWGARALHRDTASRGTEADAVRWAAVTLLRS